VVLSPVKPSRRSPRLIRNSCDAAFLVPRLFRLSCDDGHCRARRLSRVSYAPGQSAIGFLVVEFHLSEAKRLFGPFTRARPFDYTLISLRQGPRAGDILDVSAGRSTWWPGVRMTAPRPTRMNWITVGVG